MLFTPIYDIPKRSVDFKALRQKTKLLLVYRELQLSIENLHLKCPCQPHFLWIDTKIIDQPGNTSKTV